MNIDALRGKKILVVGMGIEGAATVRFLRQYAGDSQVVTTDIKDGPQYLDSQEKYDIAIKSPGVPKSDIRIPYTTATNIFFANTKGKVIGVTGTKGKSTTSSLIYEILKTANMDVHLCGNIGKPLLSELQVGEDTHDIYVVELSSYQLDDIRFSPHISVFINIFPEHMNYHGSLQNYIEAKKHIVQFATTNDYFVYNPVYPQLVQFAKESRAKPVPFVKKLPFSDTDIPLLGLHNRDNVRAAVTVGSLFIVPDATMQKAVRHFKPLRHRLQQVGIYHSITFYDDAISTTPESTVVAIESLPQIGTILVGGLDRGYDFNHVVDVILSHHIKNVIYFPDTGIKIAALLKEKSSAVSLYPANSMDLAVRLSFEHTPKGTVCLLSCASPSYSLWKNFEEKGDLFQRLIQHYAASQI